MRDIGPMGLLCGTHGWQGGRAWHGGREMKLERSKVVAQVIEEERWVVPVKVLGGRASLRQDHLEAVLKARKEEGK